MTFENKESDSNIINICIHEELDTVSISNQKQLNPINKIFYKSSIKMNEIIDNSIDLIITSPPYFNIKDYSKKWLSKYISFQIKITGFRLFK